jgi:hypothetical protein
VAIKRYRAVPPNRRNKTVTVRRKAAPVNYSRRTINRPPQFLNRGGKVTVTHNEFIGNVIADDSNISPLENPTIYSMNPGLKRTFPWLSTIAINYEFYNVKMVRAHFVPILPTSTPGQVVMFMDYDSADDKPPNEIAFKNNYRCQTHSVWDEFSYMLTNNKAYKKLFIRTEPLPDNQDIKTYDFGKFYVATKGIPTGTVIGDLRFEYEIELSVPQSDKINNLLPTQVVQGDNTTTLSPLGAADQQSGANLVNIIQQPNNQPELIQFLQSGFYLLNINFRNFTANSILNAADANNCPLLIHSYNSTQVNRQSTTIIAHAINNLSAITIQHAVASININAAVWTISISEITEAQFLLISISLS